MTEKRIKTSDVIGNSYYNYTLTSTNNTPLQNSTISITCSVTDIYGQSISGKSITLYLNGVSQGARTTASNGSATWNNMTMSTSGLQVFSVENSKIEVFVDNKSEVGHTHSGYATTTQVSTLQNSVTSLGQTIDGLADVAETGDYDDLINAPTNISAFNNDVGYLTTHQDISGKIDTAGTGLSKSGTTLNHSNSITAQTTNVFKKFKYDAQGHITGTTSVAASDLPSHTHTSSQISDLSIPSASTTLPSVDTANGSYGSGTTWARSNHSHPKSSIYAEASHVHSSLDIQSPTRPWSNIGDNLPDDTTQDDINIAIDDVLTLKEDKGNKVTSLSSSSTDTQYPSAKAVYDNISPYIYDSGWVAGSTFMNTNVRSYDENHPHRIRRIGKVVHMEGIVKNNNTFGGDGTGTKISTAGLPAQFRPSNHQYSVQQGSGSNKFLLHVYPNGDIYLERYGTTSYIDVSSGSWLHMNMTWFVD